MEKSGLDAKSVRAKEMAADPHVHWNQNLMAALQQGDVDAVVESLFRGADPNQPVRGWAPVEMAIQSGQARMVEILAAQGLDLVPLRHMPGTPLSLAARTGEAGCLKALLDAGADPDGPESPDGHTPLMRAAQAGKVECARMLIEAGANGERRRAAPEAANAKEDAIRLGHLDCAALLEALELGREARGGSKSRLGRQGL